MYKKAFFFITKWIIVVEIWLGIIGFVTILYYRHDLPTLDNMEEANSGQIIQINYSDDSKISIIGDIYDNQITFNQIPSHLIDAVIATEDRSFFEHNGIDLSGIIRASYVNIKADKIVQGGSTITQQLAKMLFLKPEKTFKRKIKEVLLARQLEKTFSKEQILSLYLNRAYFGSGNYGVQSACRYYFNKSVSKINLSEAAMLAGLLKAPSKLSPNNNKDLSNRRTNQVLKNMIDAGYLDENKKKLAKSINHQQDKLQRLYFSDYAVGQVANYISYSDTISNKRIVVKTTLNKQLQETVEDSIDSFFDLHQEKIGKSQISAILMEKDGGILAMVGGRNYQKSQFNRAIYAKRQSGSVFKTFIYLTAFQNGFDPDDIMEDKKINIGKWSPNNYNNKYYGEVSLKKAFAMSLNSIAAQLITKIGEEKVIRNALKMGVTSKINSNDTTIALGTTELSLLELVNSYASIASDGFAMIPYSVVEIEGDNNKLLYKKQNLNLYKIIKGKELGDIKELLREAIENGTGRRANTKKNLYGKTGTSQNYRDAWFIGFDDNYILGIWMGNDDNSATNKITGGSIPAQIFGNIMSKI